MTNYLLITSLILGILVLSLAIVLIYEMRALVKCGSCWVQNYSDWKKELGIDDKPNYENMDEQTLTKLENKGMVIRIPDPVIIPESVPPRKPHIHRIKVYPDIMDKKDAADYLGVKLHQIPVTLSCQKQKNKHLYFKSALDEYRNEVLFNKKTKAVFTRLEAAKYLGVTVYRMEKLARYSKHQLPYYYGKDNKAYYSRDNLDNYKEKYLQSSIEETKNA